jgi:hypothetical protein
MKTSINILSDNPIGKYYLKNLSDEVIYFENNKSFDIPEGWYNFVLEYTGEKIEITDIQINGRSLAHHIYTGFFTEQSTGKIFQPATAVWTEGFFSIWIHTESGFMFQRIEESIRNGHHGLDLSLEYLHTVDKCIDIDPDWPELVKSYFRAGNGPYWWKKGTVRVPYEVVAPDRIANIDREKILNDIELDCKKIVERPLLGKNNSEHTLTRKVIRETSMFPFIELSELKNKELVKLCEQIGYTRMLNVNIQFQPPQSSFRPHIDDNYSRDCFDYIKGPDVFLMNLAEIGNQHHFKLGPAGLVPINDGVFFNQTYFSHCSYNDSDHVRPLLILHGDRNINYTVV